MGDLKTRTRSSPLVARSAATDCEQSLLSTNGTERRTVQPILTLEKIAETHCLLLELLREEAKALNDPLLINFYDMTIMRTRDGEVLTKEERVFP